MSTEQFHGHRPQENGLEQPTARTHERIDQTENGPYDRAELEANLEQGSRGLGAAALNFFRTRTGRIIGLSTAALTLAGAIYVGVRPNNNNNAAELQPEQTTSAPAFPLDTTSEISAQSTPEVRAPAIDFATPDNFVVYLTSPASEQIEPIVSLEAAKKHFEIPVSQFPTAEAAAVEDVTRILPTLVNLNTSPKSTEAYGMGQVALINKKFENTYGTSVTEELLEAVSAPNTLPGANTEGLKSWVKHTWEHNLSASQYTGRHLVSDITLGKVSTHGGVTAEAVNVRFTAQDLNLVDGRTFGESKAYAASSAWVQGKNSLGEAVWQKVYGDIVRE